MNGRPWYPRTIDRGRAIVFTGCGDVRWYGRFLLRWGGVFSRYGDRLGIPTNWIAGQRADDTWCHRQVGAGRYRPGNWYAVLAIIADFAGADDRAGRIGDRHVGIRSPFTGNGVPIGWIAGDRR